MLKIIASLMLFVSFSILPFNTQALANESPPSVFQRVKNSALAAFEHAKEHPYYTLGITAASVMAGYIGWTLTRRNLNPAAEVIAPLLGLQLAVNHQPPPQPPAQHHPNRFDHMDPEQMFQEAVAQSAQVQTRLDALQMGPADLAFQQDIFTIIRGLSTPEERLLALQAILYDHDQVFVAQQRLLDFAIMMPELPLDRIIEEFGKITQTGWSILAIVRGLDVLDVEEHPQMLDFHALRRILFALRTQTQDCLVEQAHGVLERLLNDRPLHRFDRLLLVLAERYFLATRGDFPQVAAELLIEEEACMKLLIEELFGEAFVEVQRPAVQEMVPVIQDEEEVEAPGNILRPIADEERQEWDGESESQQRERIRQARLRRLENNE